MLNSRLNDRSVHSVEFRLVQQVLQPIYSPVSKLVSVANTISNQRQGAKYFDFSLIGGRIGNVGYLSPVLQSASVFT